MSVMVSGSGPSSRKLPASTNGTPALTHSYMMPAVQPSRLHRAANAARMIDGIDGAHVIAMPVLFLAAVRLAHAQRCAQQRGLDIVHAQRVAAQQRTAPSRRGSARESPHAARVHHHRTGHRTSPSARLACLPHQRRGLPHCRLHLALRGNAVAT